MRNDVEAATRTGPDVEASPQQQRPLPHADDPVARPGQDRATAPVVEHLDVDPAGVGVEPHLGPGAGPGVLERVGQRLLDDAVRGQVHPSRELNLRPVHRERDVQPRLSELVDEPWNVGETGLGTQRIACEALSGSSAATVLAAPACTVIRLTRWATTSWSSRAIRVRSSATARRASAACSRSSWAARSLRIRSRLPEYHTKTVKKRPNPICATVTASLRELIVTN